MQTEKFKEETTFNDNLSDKNADDAARRSRETALAQIWGTYNSDKAMLDYKLEKGLIKPEGEGDDEDDDEDGYFKDVVTRAIDMGYAPKGKSYKEAFPDAYMFINTHEVDNGIVMDKTLSDDEKARYEAFVNSLMAEDEEEE